MSDLLFTGDSTLHDESKRYSLGRDHSTLRRVSNDNISCSVAEITQEQLWNVLSSLYDSNETLKDDVATLDSASRSSNAARGNGEILDGLLDTFMNKANNVLDELTVIGNSHPILAVAIYAFHEVIKLDLARRENNKKVLVVVLEMQSMLGPMFQLRHLNHKHMPEHERTFHEKRLKEIVEIITQDIKLCRSDITHFINRKFVYKLVLAKGYERKFAGHIETFLRRRKELQNVISEYTAIGISSVNVMLAEIGKKVELTDEKLDRIATVLFRSLDTPREKDVFKFMQQHGGPERCVNDLDLLPKLILKAGESTKSGKAPITNRADLEDVRKELTGALREDLDKVLDTHFLRFGKVLQVQSNNMKRMALHLENQGYMMQTQSSQLGQILDTMTTIMVLEEGKVRAKAVKLKDPDIQRVWTQMNLTNVVKAKVFVLAFRDHIRLDHSTAATTSIGTPISHTSTLPDEYPHVRLQTTFSNTGSLSRPSMKMTESNRDFHTLQLAMNSIDAETATSHNLFLEPMDEHAEAINISGDLNTPVANLHRYPEMPNAGLTITDTDSTVFRPFVPMPEPQVHLFPGPSLQSKLASGWGKRADEWALEYIDAGYVKPIVEAMDEDGTGFISARQANRFALARPAGMTLLQWMAYWAAGWHINLAKYQKDIYTILLQIGDIAPKVLITNSTCVDDYLDVPVLTRLDALLRSIRPVPDSVRKDHNLTEVASTMALSEMEKLKTNLSDMGYVIESGLDAITIAGGSPRVETWILPLIFLLLLRHRDILRLAKTVVLDHREFDAHIQSLVSVFSVFDERMENLEARFRQLNSDTDAQFHNFSYGMFFAAYKQNEFNTYDHTLLSKVRELWRPDVIISTPGIMPDTSILTKPIGETFDPNDPILEPSGPLPDGHVPHPIEGTWSGWFQPSEGAPPYTCPHRCIIHPIVNNKLVGRAEAFFGAVDITGAVGPLKNGPAGGNLNIQFSFVPEDGRYGPQLCRGTYNMEKDIIEGTYTWIWPSTPIPSGVASQFIELGDDVNRVSPAGDNDQGHWLNRWRAIDDITERNVLLGDPGMRNGIGQLPDDRTLHVRQAEGDIQQGISILRGGKDEHIHYFLTEGHNTTLNARDKINDSVDGRIDGRFVLTRISVHLLRFRYLLESSDALPCRPLARKRWAFAIEAVLDETRRRMKSVKVFNQALAERRKWIYLSMRWHISNPDGEWSPYRPLSRHDQEAYEKLQSYVPPTNARLYERIAHYMARREVHIMPVGRLRCDVCDWDLCFRRQQCIYCKDDHLLLDHRDVDLCYNCIEEPVPFRDVSHTKSHSLLRSPYRIHKYEYKNVIAEARFISERVKSMFRAQEDKRNESNKLGSHRKGGGIRRRHDNADAKVSLSMSSNPIYCACCSEEVSLPCWVCIVCSPYVFFCSRCEHSNASVTNWAAFHHSKKEHQILRISDTVEVKPFREGNGVGVQLEEINTIIASLEKKINKQLQEAQETKGVMDEMAKKVGIIWSNQHSLLQGDEEGAKSLFYKPAVAVKHIKQSAISTLTHTEGMASQSSVPLDKRVAANGEHHLELEPVEIPEIKVGVEHVIGHSTQLEKDIGDKIDALERKIDVLSNGHVPRSVLYLLTFGPWFLLALVIGVGFIFHNWFI